MESVFIFIVVLMFFLAITDLVVGVSNDAVNFLNSAIGAKAASFKTIMVIASMGVLFGSVCSSGMMEVARKGVFNPQFFTFEEIMYLFAAVMLTDIILLNFYNSIALPTSTTVSIVFELLGSAITVSFFSVLHSEGSITHWGDYINGSKAIIIIVGIFLSVAIAFIVGWLVQYITRIIVSFEYKKTMRGFGAIFGSISVALIVVFIVQKGLKGIPFISKDALTAVKDHVGLISLISMVLSFIVFQILISWKKFNVYRFVTLLGTFALAMAFASNDLVNFVGVPIASFDAYTNWKNSGVEANSYLMESLAQPIQTNPLFLFGAGIIMILTLWFSKKAHSVVKTTVNLGRQDEGVERFKANEVSRSIVKSISAMSYAIRKIIPLNISDKIDHRFVDTTNVEYKNTEDKPAFDLVRASVNLTVAAAIILGATSLQLPLSTTFVSFMVLMGTSLADKAWAQGSAVYRVSGVFTVIGGWFLTAIIALTVSVIFASLLINFQLYALIALVIVALLLIFQSYIFRKTNHYKAEIDLELHDDWFKSDFFNVDTEIKSKITSFLEHLEKTYKETINALIKRDRKLLAELAETLHEVEKQNSQYKVKLTQQIKTVPNDFKESGKVLMLVYDLEESLLYAISHIIKSSERHVSNLHPRLLNEQIESLKNSQTAIEQYIEYILVCLKGNEINAEEYDSFKKHRKKIFKLMDSSISRQIEWATSKKLSGKNTELILSILFSDRNIISHTSRLVKLFYKIKPDNMNEILEKLMDE